MGKADQNFKSVHTKFQIIFFLLKQTNKKTTTPKHVDLSCSRGKKITAENRKILRTLILPGWGLGGTLWINMKACFSGR